MLFSDWFSCCQGDWVWLKKIPVGQITTAINQNTQSLFSQVKLQGDSSNAPERKMKTANASV